MKPTQSYCPFCKTENKSDKTTLVTGNPRYQLRHFTCAKCGLKWDIHEDADIAVEIDAKIEPSLIFNRPQIQISWPIKNTKV